VVNALAIVGFVALLWWAWQRDKRPILFALVWVAVTLAPSLLVVARPPTAPLAERYLYLPSVGFCWIVGAVLACAGEGGRARQVIAQIGIVTLVLLGATLTIQRNRIWHDNYLLWSDTAAKSPADGLPLRSLAATTLERGDAASAERLFLRALELRNTTRGQFIIYNNLGTIALGRNDEGGAERYYRHALALDPTEADTLYNLGLIALRRGTNAVRTPDAADRAANNRNARALFEQARATNPYDPEIYVGLGQAARALGDEPTARRHFEQALRLGLPASTATAVRRLIGEGE
jgi:tetratricopeptide (TPR) repeat protein